MCTQSLNNVHVLVWNKNLQYKKKKRGAFMSTEVKNVKLSTILGVHPIVRVNIFLCVIRKVTQNKGTEEIQYHVPYNKTLPEACG